MTTAPTPLIDLEALDDHELDSLYSKAGQILQVRSEAALPAVVLEAVRETLAEDGDTRRPLRAVFSTSKWDNGYFWYAAEVRVTLFDGRTEEIETVDLDDTDAETALTDHVSYLAEPLDSCDTLTVTFQPPTVAMT
ncbi:hypothetical protein [Streptomyces similanensis]|uniref:Uncharacterized protein n=1 Tax=Streptomyces similanensis TaxID=1274988 RepID=A0ABP9L6V2_9ACTN